MINFSLTASAYTFGTLPFRSHQTYLVWGWARTTGILNTATRVQGNHEIGNNARPSTAASTRSRTARDLPRSLRIPDGKYSDLFNPTYIRHHMPRVFNSMAAVRLCVYIYIIYQGHLICPVDCSSSARMPGPSPHARSTRNSLQRLGERLQGSMRFGDLF